MKRLTISTIRSFTLLIFLLPFQVSEAIVSNGQLRDGDQSEYHKYLFVSPNGNDHNSGTKSEPVKYAAYPGEKPSICPWL